MRYFHNIMLAFIYLALMLIVSSIGKLINAIERQTSEQYCIEIWKVHEYDKDFCDKVFKTLIVEPTP